MKLKNTITSEPELSRPLIVDKVSAGGLEEIIVADEKERVKLAERFGLLQLPKFEANLSVMPTRGGNIYAVTGIMQADVVQQCVVTLEPLPAHIEQKIDVLFVSPELMEGGEAHELVDEQEEESEAIVNGIIDLGELISQHLGIALDPYPRKPGLAFVEAEYGEADEPVNPFAKLAELKNKKPNK